MLSKKKIVSGVLALSLSASLLAGCSSNNNGGNNGKINIELFSTKSENISTYKGFIAEYEKTHKNVNIKLEAPPEAVTVIKTRLAKRDLPDIFATDANNVYGELARSGKLVELTNEPMVKDVIPAYVKMTNRIVSPTNNKLYGLPYAANANGVIYNKSVMDKLGIKAPPTTWDEFIADLETAKKAGVTPIYFTLKDAWTAMVTWNSLAANLVPVDFPAQKNNGKASFAKDYKEVIAKLNQLLKYGQKDNFGVGYNDGNTAFAKGKSLFYIQGNWAVPEILKANPNAQIGVIPFPVTNDPSKNRLVSGIDVMFTITKDSKHPKEAKKFLEFMAQKENVQKYLDEQKAFSSLQGVYQNSPIMAGIKDNFKNGTITSFPDHYYPDGMQTANLLQAYLINVSKGKVDDQKFLKGLDKEWEKVQNR